MNIIRSILTYLFAGVVMVGALPYLYYIQRREKKVGLVQAMAEMNRLTRIYARIVLFLSGAKIKVVGA